MMPFFVATFLASSVAFAAAAPPAQHIRGTVSAVAGNRVTIATSAGDVVVVLTSKTHYAGVVPAKISEITSGTFIGTANVPGPGAASRALEVVVFPKALAGTGEGDYPWDSPGGSKMHSAMTNGTVAGAKASAMTNATVTHVANGPLKTVTLQYKGGTKVVAIPPDAPIVRIVPAGKNLIVAGAHVFVAPSPAGAAFVVVGEQGAVPPM